MPYDKSLDQELFKELKEFEETKISVGVYSYNGGEKKLQITRENRDREGNWRFAKLGRVNKAEAEEIIPLMTKATGTM